MKQVDDFKDFMTNNQVIDNRRVGIITSPHNEETWRRQENNFIWQYFGFLSKQHNIIVEGMSLYDFARLPLFYNFLSWKMCVRGVQAKGDLAYVIRLGSRILDWLAKQEADPTKKKVCVASLFDKHKDLHTCTHAHKYAYTHDNCRCCTKRLRTLRVHTTQCA